MTMEKINSARLRIFILLALPAIIGCLIAFEFRLIRISDNSMQPTLRDRDLIIVKRINHRYAVPLWRTPAAARGDVVLVLDKKGYIIKRIAAIGGDVVTRTLDGVIAVNGRALVTSKVARSDSNTPLVSKVYVPPGYIYLLGDNPIRSSDSRTLGVFSEATIYGRMIAPLRFF